MFIIEFVDLKRGIFKTNGVPFENIVLLERFKRNDKTWKRWRYWSKHFIDYIFYNCKDKAEIIEKELSYNDPEIEIFGYYSDPANLPKEDGIHKCSYKYCVIDYILFGHVVQKEYLIKEYTLIEGKGEYHTGNFGNKIFRTGYKIYRDGEQIFEFNPSAMDNYDDWKIIHRLSGQDIRRKIRISINKDFGEMTTTSLSVIGVNIPAVNKTEYIPLVSSDFQMTERGNFIVKKFGKYMFSEVNRSGYYKVVREKENYKIISLVEEFKIIE